MLSQIRVDDLAVVSTYRATEEIFSHVDAREFAVHDRKRSPRSMKTLPDFIEEPLEILSIGINPSLHGVQAGYPFAFERNRFWPALNASRLIDKELTPGVHAMHILARRYGMGFTDIVKKPTRGIKDLCAADFAHWAPTLLEKIDRFKPTILWFHGKIAAKEFLKRAVRCDTVPQWGLQPFRICRAVCFVSPNPSPANATFSLEHIIGSYDELADLRDETTISPGPPQ